MSRKRSTLTVAFLVLLLVPALVQAVEVPAETVPGSYDRSKAAADQHEMSQWLLGEEGREKAEGYSVQLKAEQVDRMSKAPENAGALLVGVTAELGAAVGFSDLDRKIAGRDSVSQAQGMLRARADGFSWHTTISSPGATALRLHFQDFALPRGAELYVYSEHGEAFGPYTGKGIFDNGEFWTHTVVGSEIRVQVRYDGLDAKRVMAASRFTIANVVHLGERFLLARYLNPDAAGADKAFCSFNASCVQNASCSTIPSAIQPAADAVAHIQYVKGGGSFICSGGLLNDTDNSSTIPYFLTANHCFSSTASANSLEAYFQFTTACGGSCFNPNGAVPRVLGSTVLSTSGTSDYTFVRLNGNAPAGSTLLGWTSTAVANSNNTQLYRISHPKGAPQAYSEQRVNTSAGTCSGIPRGQWIYSRDNFGATEGGSSGSVVMNSSGQVVGQLTGACGTNTGNVCASSQNATIDGALASYFGSISQWLNPSTGGNCHSGSNGSASYCSASCPCEDGEGDCDSNAECVAGTTCVDNVGPNYGFASWVDVCEAPSGGGGGPNSCVGNCGGQASGGCWCDSQCSFFGDCCSDKVATCG